MTKKAILSKAKNPFYLINYLTGKLVYLIETLTRRII